MKTAKFWLEGIFAGAMISIGGYVNVRVGGVMGAILFAFGLITIILSKYKLFTGMIGFCGSWKDVAIAYCGLAANAIGCAIVGLSLGPINAGAISVIDGIVAARMGLSFCHIFILGIFCGMIMTIEVKYAREGKFLPLVFGIPVFILCGFLHCVADMFYYFAALGANLFGSGASCEALCWGALPVWIVTVLGNTVGCNLPNVIAWVSKE